MQPIKTTSKLKSTKKPRFMKRVISILLIPIIDSLLHSVNSLHNDSLHKIECEICVNNKRHYYAEVHKLFKIFLYLGMAVFSKLLFYIHSCATHKFLSS